MKVLCGHVCVHFFYELGVKCLYLAHRALSSALYSQYWYLRFEGATKGTGLTFSDNTQLKGSRSESNCPIRNKKMPNPENWSK